MLASLIVVVCLGQQHCDHSSSGLRLNLILIVFILGMGETVGQHQSSLSLNLIVVILIGMDSRCDPSFHLYLFMQYM